MIKCEHIGTIQETGVQQYTFPDGTDAGYLCDDCARDNGFCPICGYFVAGSGDDRTLRSNGCCTECLEDLKYELGEYDDIPF